MLHDKALLVLFFLLIILHLDFSTKHGSSTANVIHGSFARCEKENELVQLKLVAGNPCINCMCKNKKVLCDIERCPIKKCRGILKRTRNKCCADCVENPLCLHRGRIYQNGQKWLAENCTTCTCRQGNVVCGKQNCSSAEQLTCPKGQKAGLVPGACCLQCIEATSACLFYGDPHFTTFDDRMYSFQGACKYLLTSDCRHRNFSVRVHNRKRSSQQHSWTKQLSVHIDKTVVTLSRHFVVRVNRKKVSLPFYDLPQYQITRSNFMISIATEFGLQIMWDGENYAEILAPKRFQGHLCGLCGNFDGNATDDLMLRNGTKANSVWEFGNDWKVGGRRNCNRAPAPPVQMCKSITKWLRARQQCSVLKSSASSACYSKVKPNPYFTSCINDVCKCKSGVGCACASLLAYLRACRRKGVALKWTKKTSCRKLNYENSCSGGAVYSECVSSCKWTCDKLLNNNATGCGLPCVPGCQCPAGTVWHTTSCIQTSVCLSRRGKGKT